MASAYPDDPVRDRPRRRHPDDVDRPRRPDASPPRRSRRVPKDADVQPSAKEEPASVEGPSLPVRRKPDEDRPRRRRPVRDDDPYPRRAAKGDDRVVDGPSRRKHRTDGTEPKRRPKDYSPEDRDLRPSRRHRDDPPRDSKPRRRPESDDEDSGYESPPKPRRPRETRDRDGRDRGYRSDENPKRRPHDHDRGYSTDVRGSGRDKDRSHDSGRRDKDRRHHDDDHGDSKRKKADKPKAKGIDDYLASGQKHWKQVEPIAKPLLTGLAKQYLEKQ